MVLWSRSQHALDSEMKGKVIVNHHYPPQRDVFLSYIKFWVLRRRIWELRQTPDNSGKLRTYSKTLFSRNEKLTIEGAVNSCQIVRILSILRANSGSFYHSEFWVQYWPYSNRETIGETLRGARVEKPLPYVLSKTHRSHQHRNTFAINHILVEYNLVRWPRLYSTLITTFIMSGVLGMSGVCRSCPEFR